jgi:Pirin-related protein
MNTKVIKSFSKNFRNSKLNMLFESEIPFHKPVIRFGLFMMKIQEAIQQAFQDFQPGRMGIIR